MGNPLLLTPEMLKSSFLEGGPRWPHLQILILYVKKCACSFKRIFSDASECYIAHFWLLLFLGWDYDVIPTKKKFFSSKIEISYPKNPETKKMIRKYARYKGAKKTCFSILLYLDIDYMTIIWVQKRFRVIDLAHTKVHLEV